MNSELIRDAESWAKFFDKARFSYWQDGKEIVFGGDRYELSQGYVTRIELHGDMGPQDVNIFRRFMAAVIAEMRQARPAEQTRE